MSNGRYPKGTVSCFPAFDSASVGGEEGNVYKRVRFTYLEFSKQKAQYYTLSGNRDSQTFIFLFPSVSNPGRETNKAGTLEQPGNISL